MSVEGRQRLLSAIGAALLGALVSAAGMSIAIGNNVAATNTQVQLFSIDQREWNALILGRINRLEELQFRGNR